MTWYNCMTSSSLNCLTGTVQRSLFIVEISRRHRGLMRTTSQLDGMPELLRDGSGVHGLTHKQAWSDKFRTMQLLYQEKCNMYWKKQIDACGGNMKKLWWTLNDVLGDATTPILWLLVILWLVSEIKLRMSAHPLLLRRCTMSRSNWRRQLMSGMLSLLTRLKNLSPQLRVSLVSWIQFRLGLLRRCVYCCHLLLLCCVISLWQLVYLAFKSAVIRPLLKKNGLDSSQLKNYQPVSNLSFLSKPLDRVVQVRLQAFIDSNNLWHISVYRQYHSTETAETHLCLPSVPQHWDGCDTSLSTVSTTALRRLRWSSTTICYLLLTLANWPFFVLTWRRLSTLTAASFRATVWSQSLLQWFHSDLAGRSFRVLYCN